MVNFHSSPTIVLVNASEHFPHYKMLRNSQVRTRILSDSTRMLNHWSISTWTSYLGQPYCLCWYTDKSLDSVLPWCNYAITRFPAQNTDSGASIFFHAVNCFDAGISSTVYIFCATKMCPQWFSCLTQHSLCSPLLFLVVPTPAWCHHVNSRFFSNKLPGSYFRTIPSADS